MSKSMIMSFAAKEKMRLKKEGEDQEYDQFVKKFKTMSDKQTAILEKRFKVNEHFSISRGDYENLPCPMLAWTMCDESMKILAEHISQNLARWNGNDEESMEDDFWKTMEDEAVAIGMEYYEDLDDDYRAELEYNWMNLN